MGTDSEKHNGIKIMSLLFILNKAVFFFFGRVEMVDVNYP